MRILNRDYRLRVIPLRLIVDGAALDWFVDAEDAEILIGTPPGTTLEESATWTSEAIQYAMAMESVPVSSAVAVRPQRRRGHAPVSGQETKIAYPQGYLDPHWMQASPRGECR